jgi:flavin reductase (DIM6/NTAB) family NADH-FMN oxidoreductase RutF
MFYEPRLRNHGLKHDPFKALVVPRPIGWIGTVDAQGRPNLAPYSFFNGISDRPPMVYFSSAGHKDSLRNAQATGGFTCSLATSALRDPMNLSSAAVASGVDEFELAGLTQRPSRLIQAPSVAQSPAAFECQYWKTIELPGDPQRPELSYSMVLGIVVGVHVDAAFIRDGRVDTGAMLPLSRLGYMDYSVFGPNEMFSLNRPTVEEDGRTAHVDDKPWDGVYR